MRSLRDVQIRNRIIAGKPLAKSDGDGLTFTLLAGGAASWVLRYRINGKQRELTLGRYPDITLGAARKLAAERRVEVSTSNWVSRHAPPRLCALARMVAPVKPFLLKP